MHQFAVARTAMAVAAVVGLAGCSAPPSVPVPTANETLNQIGTTLDSALPAPLLSLRFRSADGRTVRLADFVGKSVVVSDAMTLCQETCPLDTATLVQTARAEDAAKLGSDEVFLSITVDPGRDTAAQLAAYRLPSVVKRLLRGLFGGRSSVALVPVVASAVRVREVADPKCR